MKQRTLDWALRIWVVVTVAAGVGMVIDGTPPLPIVGVLLIIVGLMSIMLAMQVYLGDFELDFVE